MRDYRDIPLADPDGLRRYREEAGARQREIEQARRSEKREQRRTALSAEIEGLRTEIADVYATIKHQHDVVLDACGTALGQYGDKILDRCEGMIQSVQRELFSLIERRFCELEARIAQARADILAADGKLRKDFRFANERQERDDDAITELPNPLPPRRAMN
jgi:hypothetical protein